MKQFCNSTYFMHEVIVTPGNLNILLFVDMDVWIPKVILLSFNKMAFISYEI